MYKKKLIEVALPLKAINEASAKEKSIRQGHPSTLHLWWARRPLATSKAVIWASLVDDPSAHPEEFPTEEDQLAERERLFKILEELVLWKNSNDVDVLKKAKAEIVKSTNGEIPEFLDPFGGGGMIPFEAQKLGLDTQANDLNPVAVMINKAMLEIPQKLFDMQPINPEVGNFGSNLNTGLNGFIEDLRYYANYVESEAKKRIGSLFPSIKVHGKSETVMAWLRTYTVKCTNPACGCESPLIKSFDLTKKKNGQFHVNPIVNGKEVDFVVEPGKSSLKKGTVGRKGAKCICCGETIDLDYIREQGREGNLGLKLFAVITEGDRKKNYYSPSVVSELSEADKPVEYPDTEIAYYPGCTNCRIYGMKNFSQIYTNRQLTAINTFSDIVIETKSKIINDIKSRGLNPDDFEDYINALEVYLAFGVDRLATKCTKISLWNSTRETIEQPFGRQAMPMVWTFPESNVFSNSSGGWKSSMDWIYRFLESITIKTDSATVLQEDAMEYIHPRPVMVSTDPPYYSNVPYADLSDFFYLWLRKILKDNYPELFSTISTPKANELVAEKYRLNGDEEAAKRFFENGMFKTFQNIYKYASDAIPVTVYYAFKQKEMDDAREGKISSSGWETMLEALIKAGFEITGTWPLQTEMTTGLKTSLNSLSTSIVLVCRKKAESKTVSRRNFVKELKKELQQSLHDLQHSNIAPVDMAQSAIGPGMSVFSKYNKVLESDGSPMSVRSALEIINQEIDSYFNEQDSALRPEDRFCVELYSQYGFDFVPFGTADSLARAKNTSIPKLEHLSIFNAEKGKAHLLDRNELPESPDKYISLWGLTQMTVREMEKGGVVATAEFLNDRFGWEESIKSLTYRLFTIAEKKRWVQESFVYNSLIMAWSDIEEKLSELRNRHHSQEPLF